MPFCPQCRFEFQGSVKTCPECKVDLVDKLDSEGTTDEDFVEVYTVNNRMEADVIRSALEEAGIAVMVRDTRTFPVLPDWRAEFVIEVVQGKEVDARKVLEEARADGALTGEGRFL